MLKRPVKEFTQWILARNHIVHVDPYCPYCHAILPSVGATFCPSCAAILIGDQEALDQQRIVALYRKAENCFREEDWSGGIYLLIDALRLDPANAETRLRLTEARQQFRVTRLIEWAEEHYFSRNLDGALKNLLEVQALQPENEEVQQLIVEVEAELEQGNKKRTRRRKRQSRFNHSMVVIFYLLMAAFIVVLAMAMFMLIGVRIPFS